MFDPDHDKLRLKMWTNVENGIRNAVLVCWMSLPKERQSVDEVEKEIRRIVDRALKNFREDASSFEIPPCT